MRITIHQPEYLPWLGFFHKLSQADIYVALDNVQYRHKYYQNRNRVRSSTGEVWINVPVLLKGKRTQQIQNVQINNTDKVWSQKNWRTIVFNYQKAPYFAEYGHYFETLYAKPWESLAELNLEILKQLCAFLEIDIKILRASELHTTEQGTHLIFEICKKLNTDEYISGISGIAGRGKELEDEFLNAGIKVCYDEFHHPVYQQMHAPFIPCMSVIDLLFCHGPKSLDIIHGKGVSVMDELFL